MVLTHWIFKACIKPDAESMKRTSLFCHQCEGRLKIQFFIFDCQEVKSLDEAGVGEHGGGVQHLHRGLAQGQVPQGAHVQPVHVSPPLHAALLLHPFQVDTAGVGQQPAARLEVPVAGEEHRGQHGLVEERVPHPFRHNQVHLVHGQVQVLDLPLDQLHRAPRAVQGHHLSRVAEDAGAVDPDDAPGTRPGGEQRQHAGPTAHVQDHLALNIFFVFHDGIFVSSSSRLIS
mmetsp:Transcript_26716/g.48572  ORF Transcript_26716/g.48572 Transcript_26716/m.48572 type:complete len:230 (-) Transcript_26716:125-814(-)